MPGFLLLGVFGIVMLSMFPVVGAFVTAAAFVGVRDEGRGVGAAMLLGGVVVTFVTGALSAPDTDVARMALVGLDRVVFVGSSGLAMYLAVEALKRRPACSVFVALAFAIAAATAASDAVGAYLAGTTVATVFSEIGVELRDLLVGSYGPTATVQVVDAIERSVASVIELWPSLYVVQGAAMAAVAFTAVRFVARESVMGRSVVPDAWDLSPHALWPLVLGLVATAVSYLRFDGSDVLRVVGSNLMVAARVILSVQGFAVLSHLLTGRDTGRFTRALATVGALVFESVFWFLSAVGLADFWLNLRKLPREAGTGSADDAVR